jgi:hypothetical protein
MSGNPLTLTTMQRHAEQLCREHDISWRAHQRWRLDASYAVRESREINTAPIRGALSYATVLHEIGHIVGRYQHRKRRMTRKIWAWNWARSNALAWTPAMERSAVRCLRKGDPGAVDDPCGWGAEDHR